MFRIINYYINNKNAVQYGYEDTAIIVDIKKIKTGPHGSYKYYLIANYNREKIKSLYFLDSSYSVGESIKIIEYKNRKYIQLSSFSK